MIRESNLLNSRILNLRTLFIPIYHTVNISILCIYTSIYGVGHNMSEAAATEGPCVFGQRESCCAIARRTPTKRPRSLQWLIAHSLLPLSDRLSALTALSRATPVPTHSRVQSPTRTSAVELSAALFPSSASVSGQCSTRRRSTWTRAPSSREDAGGPRHWEP